MPAQDPDTDAAIADYLRHLAAYRSSSLTAGYPAELAVPRFPAVADALYREPPEVYARLATGLAQISNGFAGGALAIQLGSLIEKGMRPEPLGRAMAAWLPGAFADARRFVAKLAELGGRADALASPVAQQAASAEPAGAAAWAGLGMCVPAAMAAWVRDAASRRDAASNSQLIADAQAIAAHSRHGYFIAELLGAADGIELVVLAPEQRKGFVVELEIVRNIAHLQALLEDALVGDPDAGWLAGPRIDPKIAAAARSERMMNHEQSYAIHWNFQHRGGLREQPGSMNVPTISATLAFEWPVQQLFEASGPGVILMRPPGPIQRSCGAGSFFAPIHDQLRSRVVVRKMLEAGEIDRWLSELAP